MEITKVKLTKFKTLNVNYTNDQGDRIVIEGIHEAHQDLIDTLGKLTTHLAYLTEQADGDNDGYVLSKMKVTGFTIGGSDDHLGAVLIGQRSLENNRVLNLVSPFFKFDPELEPYDGCHLAKKIIFQVCDETEKYLSGEKIGGATQGDLFAPAPDPAKVQEMEDSPI